MNIYLLRHAEAEMIRTSDQARELTPKGMEQSRTVGRFLAKRHIVPELILTSPYPRAEQTARLANEASGGAETAVQIARFLASGMSPETALEELRAYQRIDALMLVGHQPDFGMLAASLIGLADSGRIAVGKASLTCIEVERIGRGGGCLRFSIPVKLM
jgi:phosphohistidine phosphatase